MKGGDDYSSLFCAEKSLNSWLVRLVPTRNGPPPKAGGVTGSRDGRHTLAMYLHNMQGKPAQFLPKYVLELEIQFAITY